MRSLHTWNQTYSKTEGMKSLPLNPELMFLCLGIYAYMYTMVQKQAWSLDKKIGRLAAFLACVSHDHYGRRPSIIYLPICCLFQPKGMKCSNSPSRQNSQCGCSLVCSPFLITERVKIEHKPL